VSVSVDSNFANYFYCDVKTRADLIVHAVKALIAENAKPGGRLFHRLDLANIGLIGHSRGGDGVVQAARDIRVQNIQAEGAPIGVKVVCGLAPTDYRGSDPSSRVSLGPLDTGFYYLLYGAFDGDVNGEGGPSDAVGSGFRPYDRATCHKASTFLTNFSHNGFNAIWATQPDTSHAIQSPAVHQAIAVEYLGDLMRWRLKGEALGRRFDGGTPNANSEPASLQWWFGAKLTPLDDFQRQNTSLNQARGKPAWVEVKEMGDVLINGDNHYTPHQTVVAHVHRVPAPSDTWLVGAVIPASHRDWREYDVLLFSLSASYDPATLAATPLPPPRPPPPRPRVKITLLDTTGASAVVDWTTYGVDRPSLPVLKEAGFSHSQSEDVCLMRLETISVELTKFTGVNLGSIASYRFDTDPPGPIPGVTHAIDVFLDNVALMKR
jgi:hypothetical protein